MYVIMTLMAHICGWYVLGILSSMFSDSKYLKIKLAFFIAIISSTLQFILHYYYEVM